MIVFHGSPFYFSNFDYAKIGISRVYNQIEGFYFTKDISNGFLYTQKYYTAREASRVFVPTPTENNMTGYLYICEVPDSSALLDLDKTIGEQSQEVQSTLWRIINKRCLTNYFNIDEQTKGTLLIGMLEYYSSAVRNINRVKLSASLSKEGLKGCIIRKESDIIKNYQEIVIFAPEDIKIKQCFRIDNIPPDYETSELKLHEMDMVSILFKRFDNYYFATGSVLNELQIIYLPTNDNCPEILDEIQTLDDIEHNPFVIAYSIHRRGEVYVSQANIVNVRAYSPRFNQQAQASNIYTAGDIKNNIEAKQYKIYSKVTNKAEFDKYQESLPKGNYEALFCTIYHDCLDDTINLDKANTLLLQQSQKPWFILPRHEYIETPQQIEVQETNKQKMTEQEVQKKTEQYMNYLRPMLKRTYSKLYGNQ